MIAKALLASSLFTSSIVGPVDGVLTQGDEINIEGPRCTVGYVTPTHAYTAGHCGDVGQVVTDTHGTTIGTITADGPYLRGSHDRADDWAVIELDAPAGGNVFSGDGVVSHQDVIPGDRVCKYGMTTGTTCGNVAGVGDGVIYMTAPIYKGDSGGAVWVVGKGFYGTVSGWSSGEFFAHPVATAWGPNIDN